MNNTEMPDEIYVEHSADEWVNGKYVPLYEGGETWAGGKTKYIRADKAAPDVNAELLEALNIATNELEEHSKCEDCQVGVPLNTINKCHGAIARAEQKGQSHE